MLLGLLMQANPILSDWLQGWQGPGLDLPRLMARALFWAGLALLIWPLLTPAPLAALPPHGLAPRALPPHALPGVNADAVAAYLGFHDATNFRRSFKRWTGQTPQLLRHALALFVAG